MKFLRVAVVLVALVSVASAQTRKSTTSETLTNAIAEHLKACHDIHKFALNVDHVPYNQSPLGIMHKFSNAKSLSKSCANDANSIVESWRQLSGSDREKDEAGWAKKLGFPFDEVLGDYNFFNFMVLNTIDSLMADNQIK
jgi:hypothetical protein